ncbi:MAG TPA: GlsB/YeaQ/YmgE family stress response membrane protein [Acidimicrobiales bacterium]|nr:GlsB/YeaQ/YmgE family stress response membrane protein [Acidimicrobiales bacterium]
MFDFWTVMYLLVVGLVAGYIARLLVRGTGDMSFWATLLAGVVGSFVGGLLGYLLFGWDDDEGWVQPGGIIGSIIGAVIVVLLWRAWSQRHPSAGRPSGTAGPRPGV